MSVNKHAEMTMGFQVLPEFVVVQHGRDVQILNALKAYFQTGVVRSNHGDRLCYRVRDLNGLLRICKFFEKHKLRTKKQIDFLKFRDVVRMILNREHLSKEGIDKITKVISAMNNRAKLIEQDKDIVHATVKAVGIT